MHPHEHTPGRCPRSHAEQMRLRLAKSRLEQTRAVDLGLEQAAGLLFIIERLEHALEDVIKLVEDGCAGEPSDS